MSVETTKLTIRLPRENIEFAKAYAREHGINVTELIDRYMRRLRALEERTASTELESITGLVPSDVDVRDVFRQHRLDKHG